ncbi:hypothetical protein ACFQ4K_13800 [Tistrella bauzanensis]
MLAVAAIIDQATAILAGGGLLDGRAPRFDPAGYRHATLAVEQRFQVPETTISPVMRRFLWQLARISRPTRIYGAGTYAGFGFAFLVAGRATVDDEFQAWGWIVTPRRPRWPGATPITPPPPVPRRSVPAGRWSCGQPMRSPIWRRTISRSTCCSSMSTTPDPQGAVCRCAACRPAPAAAGGADPGP